MSKRKTFRQTYRLIPIFLGTLLIFALICGLAILIWSTIAFLSKADVETAQSLPGIIWLAALFLSAGAMTLLTRGGTVFPALFLTLITVVISCFLASEGALSFLGVMAKLGYSLLASVLGFIIAKLYLLFLRPHIKVTARGREEKTHESQSFEEMDLFEKMDLQLPDSSDFHETDR